MADETHAGFRSVAEIIGQFEGTGPSGRTRRLSTAHAAEAQAAGEAEATQSRHTRCTHVMDHS